jgi:hypothetical protein
MNKIFLSGVFAFGAVLAPALANDVEAFCVGFAEGNGWDTEPCSCVGDVASGDQSVADAVLALETAEDVDLMDDAVKEALSVCFPENV